MSRVKTQPRSRARRRVFVRWITATTAVVVAACLGFVAPFAMGARVVPPSRSIVFADRPHCELQQPPLVLMTGSSTMEAWQTSATDLASLNTKNIGIGGTTLHDQLTYLAPVVSKFDPKVIVMFAGANDLAIGGKGRAAGVVAEFKTYIERVEKELPGVVVYFVSINVTPGRVVNTPEVNAVNAAVKSQATTSGVLRYIETNSALLNNDGTPNASNFRQDAIHLNDAGYKVFAKIIEERLVADGYAKRQCVYPDGTVATGAPAPAPQPAGKK